MIETQKPQCTYEGFGRAILARDHWHVWKPGPLCVTLNGDDILFVGGRPCHYPLALSGAAQRAPGLGIQETLVQDRFHFLGLQTDVMWTYPILYKN